ncbi:MAG: TonB family protein [Thioalkalispiraceae bacterium]
MSAGIALGLHALLLLGLWSTENEPRYTVHKTPTINIRLLAETPAPPIPVSEKTETPQHTANTFTRRQQQALHPVATKPIKPIVKNQATGKNEKPPTPVTNQQATANFDALYQLLHHAINQNKHYPLAALRMRQQGKVRVSFKLFNNGNVDALQVAQSSGYHSLDKAALLAVERIQPFQPAADYIAQVKDFQLDIIFQL